MKKLFILCFTLFTAFSCSDDADDFIAVCDSVTNISSHTITSNSATITWNAVNASAEYSIEYGITGFTLGNGTTISEADTDLELTNLIANTTYDIYIQTLCDANNMSLYSNVYSFTTSVPNVAAEFKTNLSELNLFSGNLNELMITSKAFEYDLNTRLFSDYAHKQRIIALPEGTSMEYDGDGLPIFPDNTVIAKTFYFNIDDRDLSLGKTIIETRVLIKLNGLWETGDYKWNSEQTDAVLDLEGSSLPVTWIDTEGNSNSSTFQIPSNTDCFTCHSNNDNIIPIGPKLRSMNFEINGVNQLEQFIANQTLTGLSNSASVRSLANWQDTSLPLETRVRAYMDINCAHCHIPGGSCADQSTLNLALETPLEESNIPEQSVLIDYRVSFYLDGISMPFIGTTMRHVEGLDLIQEYMNTF
ncbi:fibronectin type III domain-containing protein [Winogradskyella sp. Asnod2-B02-A]|uniref:fibronectin type III domain-containing protein n=1 Tax=Winogradskyella sp. Asnod2-B02-A TaxID=3160583 RepID=UPI0038686A9D